MELKHYSRYHDRNKPGLLIVPYGIETNFSNEGVSPGNTFNRTLWN